MNEENLPGNHEEALAIPPRHKAQLRALSASFFVFAILAIVAMITTQVYISTQNKANGDRLIDCTTPGGKCYENGQQQTSKAIGTINEVTIAANFCALKIGAPLTEQDFDRFVTCVKNHITVVPS